MRLVGLFRSRKSFERPVCRNLLSEPSPDPSRIRTSYRRPAFMARSVHQSLLAAAVALVVGGSALAQNSLQDAVNLLRLNKTTEAVQKLQEIIQGDPSNEEAHDLYRSVSQDEWYMLMTEKGEVQKIARSILERAKSTQRERSRDEAAIDSLVATATESSNDYGTRQAAVNKLVGEHGEFAVPALVTMLGDSDNVDGQIYAISVLRQLHSVAVLPLIEALKSSNDLTVQNACAALNLIGDSRALPALTHLANDDRVNISTIAKKFVKDQMATGDAPKTPKPRMTFFKIYQIIFVTSSFNSSLYISMALL